MTSKMLSVSNARNWINVSISVENRNESFSEDILILNYSLLFLHLLFLISILKLNHSSFLIFFIYLLIISITYSVLQFFISSQHSAENSSLLSAAFSLIELFFTDSLSIRDSVYLQRSVTNESAHETSFTTMIEIFRIFRTCMMTAASSISVSEQLKSLTALSDALLMIYKCSSKSLERRKQ